MHAPRKGFKSTTESPVVRFGKAVSGLVKKNSLKNMDSETTREGQAMYAFGYHRGFAVELELIIPKSPYAYPEFFIKKTK